MKYCPVPNWDTVTWLCRIRCLALNLRDRRRRDLPDGTRWKWAPLHGRPRRVVERFPPDLLWDLRIRHAGISRHYIDPRNRHGRPE